MKLSFKFKIATISFVVSGALLAVFGFVFFTFAFQAGLDRIDREILTMADSSLHTVRPPEHWQNFDKSLQFIYGETRMASIALRVVEPDGTVLFQSDNAPTELTALPRPARAEPPPPLPGAETSLMDRLDRDLDGLVSPDEFDGPPHAFGQADADADGFISRQEALHIPRAPGKPRPEFKQPPLEFQSSFQTLETATGNWRIGLFSNTELSVMIAMDMSAFYADINRFRTAFFITVSLGLILLGLTSWFLAARAMHPVAVIARTAAGITAKGLDRRIPMVGKDIELERLVTIFNHMLDRLEKSYHQAVRFSADAAHELQTPLTILQGELDNAIQTSADGSDEQQRYSLLLDELRNLKAVVQKLLLLAHADEGRLRINAQPVDLSELICDAAEDTEMMAPKLQIETRIPDGVTGSADPALLNQALRNMTSNAAKYTDPNGRVLFTLEQKNEAVRFTLANTSPPIPDDDRPLLFDRFHRVDKARTAAGSGLGLSLAREIARAHGGDLVLNPYAHGMVSFTLTLPAG